MMTEKKIMLLFIHSYKATFLRFLFCIITMNSLNSDNHSKTSAFENFGCLLYKYYPRLPKSPKKLSI